MTWAAVLLATALLVGGDRSRARIRASRTVPMEVRHRQAPAGDPLAAASSFDVLAACLHSGMAVSTAAAATAQSAPAEMARLLNRAADLLALGADPATAWSDRHLGEDDHAVALLRLARLFGKRRRGARLGVDRGAARGVLSACVPVPGHRSGGRRAGR